MNRRTVTRLDAFADDNGRLRVPTPDHTFIIGHAINERTIRLVDTDGDTWHLRYHPTNSAPVAYSLEDTAGHRRHDRSIATLIAAAITAGASFEPFPDTPEAS